MKWQLIFCFGWWDWDIAWKEKYQKKCGEIQSFDWWRFGPLELRVFKRE